MAKLYIIIGTIFTGIIIFELLKALSTKDADEYSYSKRKILTDTEQKFYNELKQIVADRYYIFPQIHLANLLTVVSNNRKIWKRLFNKIIQKSVDFVLIDKQTFETKFVIELDDYTHSRANRIERDEFVDKSLNSAGIAILHIKEHNLSNLETFINKTMNKNG